MLRRDIALEVPASTIRGVPGSPQRAHPHACGREHREMHVCHRIAQRDVGRLDPSNGIDRRFEQDRVL
jgi:hypothetical protein